MHIDTLDRMTTSSMGVRLLDGVARMNGLDFVKASERRGLDIVPALNSMSEIKGSQQIDFDKCFTELTRSRADLWFALGLRTHLPVYGAIGLATLTAPTLRHVVHLHTDCNHLHMSLMQVTMTIEGETLVTHHVMDNVPEELHDFILMRDLGAALAAQRELWCGAPPIDRIELSARAPAGKLENRGVPIVPGCAETRLIFKPGVLDVPLFYGDEILHAHYERECRQKVASLKTDIQPIDDHLAQLLETAISQDRPLPSLSDLADLLNVSERTLQRRLAAEGKSFREAMDAARRNVAERLLRESPESVADMSARLGYAEPSSFYHACKRWTGLSPRALRSRTLVSRNMPSCRA